MILKGEKIGHEFIFMFFALLCLITGALVFLLPETRGREVPDSVQETENYSAMKKAEEKAENYL